MMAPLRPLRSGLTVVVLYGLACGLSLWMAGRPGQVATLWFANPIGTVALLMAPRRQWPWLLLGLGLANFTANAVEGLDSRGLLFDPAQWPLPVLASSLTFMPGNLFEMVLAAWALGRRPVDGAVFQDPMALGRCLLVGAVLPVIPGALAGSLFLTWGHGGDWRLHFVTWLSGSVIGSTVLLPLALVVGVLGRAPLVRALTSPRHLLPAAITLALAALAFTSLPFPFVAVSLVLALLSLFMTFEAVAVTTVAVAVLQALLIREGVLLAPPSTGWWGDALFYLAVLESLLPGVLLSAALGGRETTIARLRSLYAQTPVMLHSVDADFRLLAVSDRWLEALGYREEEVLGQPLTDFFTEESARRAREVALPASFRDGQARDVPYVLKRRDGTLMEVLLSAIWERDAQGRPVRSMAVMEDVTERNRLAQRSHYAEHDPLTGLPNRILLDDRLQQACQRAARGTAGFAVGFLDLDRFKSINDTLGHEAGDEVLRQVSHRLRGALRESDTLSRLAGDEFVLVLHGVTTEDTAHMLGRRLLEALSRTPCRLRDHDGREREVRLGGSLGLALYGPNGRTPSALMQRADDAMYEAKRRVRQGLAHEPVIAASGASHASRQEEAMTG